jgi:hypothetical protein
MKNLIIAAVLSVSLITISSCQKDWTCSCYHSTLNTTTSTAINGQTYLNAKSQCADMNVSSPLGNTSCTLENN